MKRFLKALLVFLHMYRHGFYWSENTKTDRYGTRWGFYRFNETHEAGLFDVDFSLDKDHVGYFHVHGDDFRMNIKAKERVEKIRQSQKDRRWLDA